MFYGRGFKTGVSKKYYTNVANISNKAAFSMKHISPWSYKFSGIGKVRFYKGINFRREYTKYARVSSNDRPKKFTFGSNNNAKSCKCHPAKPNCDRRTCGKREIIGSIKFCHGISIYKNVDYVGTPFTYYKCDAKTKKSYCFKNIIAPQKNYKSLHFDSLIKHVRLYKRNNCTDVRKTYKWNKKDKGTVKKISSALRNKVRSIQITFK